MEFQDVQQLSSTTCLPAHEASRERVPARAAAGCGDSRRSRPHLLMKFTLIPLGSVRLSLQTRILALFLALMAVVQIGGFALVNTVGTTAARTTIGDELIAGEKVFQRLLHQEKRRLEQGARLLATDSAFRQAIATGDRDTISTVL
jgi:hypothetical protein